MSGQLLERDAELDVLSAALDSAVAGQGSVVLILGEAGIGKTSLLRSFVAKARARARVLSGACDDLMTPRTLGPLRDAAAGSTGPLATAIADGNRDDLLIAVREELADGARPTLLVVEDVHWADDATLDVLRYLSRRINELPAPGGHPAGDDRSAFPGRPDGVCAGHRSGCDRPTGATR